MTYECPVVGTEDISDNYIPPQMVHGIISGIDANGSIEIRWVP